MTYETMPESLYLIVEAEPWLSICGEWKARHCTARDATSEFVEKQGSTGFFPDLYGDLIGIATQASVPAGWSIKKSRRVAHHDRLVPMKGHVGDSLRAQIEALPRHPRHSEIAAAIGHPCQVSYESAAGCGFSVMGYALEPVSVGWSGETFIIKVPNADRYVAEMLEQNPGCTITQGQWTVPDGLRSITKAEQELIYAQAAVDEERAVA